MPQVQFQSAKQKHIPVQRVQKKIKIPQLQLAQETMRSEIRTMTLEKTFEERDTLNQAVVKIANEAARAWIIECLGYEIREIILPPRSSRQWRCRRKPSDANVKETRRAKSIRHEESDKIAIVLNNKQLSAQDPGAHAQPKQKLSRHHNNLRCHEQKTDQQSEGMIGWDQQAYLRRCQQAKDREKQRSERLQQIRSWDGCCHGHTPAHDLNHWEGDGQEPCILAERNRRTASWQLSTQGRPQSQEPSANSLDDEAYHTQSRSPTFHAEAQPPSLGSTSSF